jgi:hypothetical protein
MERGEADLRPGWDRAAERLEDGALRYWLSSGRYGIEGAGDGWWRVIDRAGRWRGQWSCFEGAQLRAEALEAEDSAAGAQRP